MSYVEISANYDFLSLISINNGGEHATEVACYLCYVGLEIKMEFLILRYFRFISSSVDHTVTFRMIIVLEIRHVYLI